MEIEDILIKFLKEGMQQPEIADMLKCNNIQPCSLSSIEKTLKSIRKKYNVKTNFQLGWELCKLQIVRDISKR